MTHMTLHQIIDATRARVRLWAYTSLMPGRVRCVMPTVKPLIFLVWHDAPSIVFVSVGCCLVD
jgi:hypothetical protein